MESKNGTGKKVYLYETVADAIETDLLNGAFDKKLPPEQALCEKYCVSRSILREAMKILNERKLINTVVGSGAFIIRPDVEDMSAVFLRFMNMYDVDVLDAYDCRIALETSAAAMAALNITESRLAELEQLYVRTNNPDLSSADRREADYQFHMNIINASGSTMMMFIAGAMGFIFRDIIVTSRAIGKESGKGSVGHEGILNAIKEHDSYMAEHMMYVHLKSGRTVMEERIRSLHLVDENGALRPVTYRMIRGIIDVDEPAVNNGDA